MVWEGLSARELCELFKDPARNGHKSIPQIVAHMQTPLVLWGWHPGEGRDPDPMPFPEIPGKGEGVGRGRRRMSGELSLVPDALKPGQGGMVEFKS